MQLKPDPLDGGLERKELLRRLAVLVPDDVPVFIDLQKALALVENHDLVLPRVANNSAEADADLEGLYYDRAASLQNSVDRLGDRLHCQIRLHRTGVGVQYQFCVRVGEAQASCTLVPPDEFVPERLAVEAQGRIEVAHGKTETIDLAEYRGHVSAV